MWSGVMISPRYLTRFCSKAHFSGLRYKSLSQRHLSTSQVVFLSPSLVAEKIRMSSMYTMIRFPIISILKISSINAWKVAGELHSPKNMTVSSNSLRFVLNAAFHSSPFLIHMLLYPYRTSSLVKYQAPFSLSNRLATNGNGYVFFTIPSYSQR